MKARKVEKENSY